MMVGSMTAITIWNTVTHLFVYTRSKVFYDYGCVEASFVQIQDLGLINGHSKGLRMEASVDRQVYLWR